MKREGKKGTRLDDFGGVVEYDLQWEGFIVIELTCLGINLIFISFSDPWSQSWVLRSSVPVGDSNASHWFRKSGVEIQESTLCPKRRSRTATSRLDRMAVGSGGLVNVKVLKRRWTLKHTEKLVFISKRLVPIVLFLQCKCKQPFYLETNVLKMFVPSTVKVLKAEVVFHRSVRTAYLSPSVHNVLLVKNMRLILWCAGVRQINNWNGRNSESDAVENVCTTYQVISAGLLVATNH